MKKLVVSSLVALFAAGSAQAAPSGGRIEAFVGYDNNKFSAADFNVDASTDGVVFGVGLGYDLAVSSGVALGIDLEASDSSAELSASEGGISAKASAERDLYAGGRITFAASDRVNLYVKGGYTNARLKASVTGGGLDESVSGTVDGFRVGGGVQFMISKSVYLGGEYRYSNYEGDYSRNQVVGTLGFRF
ncbi:MAG TPA: porin family protein [Sphingomonas sp.]|nr:porin family protein [Sphingomonas sp.]